MEILQDHQMPEVRVASPAWADHVLVWGHGGKGSEERVCGLASVVGETESTGRVLGHGDLCGPDLLGPPRAIIPALYMTGPLLLAVASVACNWTPGHRPSGREQSKPAAAQYRQSACPKHVTYA